MTTDIGIWLATLLTLAIYSFLYKDNPIYKMAEHIFVGTSAGYGFVVTYQNVFKPMLFDKLKDAGSEPMNLILIIPLIGGIMLLFKLSRKNNWVARYPLSFMVGVGSGMGITNVIKSDVISQVHAIIFKNPMWISGDIWTSLFNILYVVAVLTSLLYFFFSAEHKGAIGKTARIGIWFLMISFGAAFGFTVMARISLLISRVQFLLEDFLGISL
ncbi:MAG: hypothetical protein C0601_07540 [Candidatus Muiribacterium halophilum]|uniref:Uncharacterized protein n=1 Tax=Muiribacterium halophilum TaxID=2053465 RepID=A0A2N5ZFE3_MUIH1|nr:MAG: hypothetical protein C0601_07540 [Candidatus Muirbacterium halophilum]